MRMTIEGKRSRWKDIHGNIFYESKNMKYPSEYHNINDGNLYITKGEHGIKVKVDEDDEYVLRDNTVFNKVERFNNNNVGNQIKFINASTGEEVTKYLNPESLPEPKKESPQKKPSFMKILKKKITPNTKQGGKRRTKRRSNKKRTNKRKKTMTRMKKRKTHKRKTNKRRRKR